MRETLENNDNATVSRIRDPETFCGHCALDRLKAMRLRDTAKLVVSLAAGGGASAA